MGSLHRIQVKIDSGKEDNSNYHGKLVSKWNHNF